MSRKPTQEMGIGRGRLRKAFRSVLLSSRAQDDAEPSPDETRHALRDIIGRCIYGVDINPMSVELCKVSLWMEGVEPGKPLSFLDHHIKCGNSLIGTTPELIAGGIPDDAFQLITGNDKELVKAIKKRNKEESAGNQLNLFGGQEVELIELTKYAGAFSEISGEEDSSIKAVHKQEEKYRKITADKGYLNDLMLHNAWCGAFFQEIKF